jgi:hypothetical protein
MKEKDEGRGRGRGSDEEAKTGEVDPVPNSLSTVP